MSDIDPIQEKFAAKVEELKRVLPIKYEGSNFSDQNCAALTMTALLEVLGIEDQNAINMASCTASVAGVCGAVNAGLMGVGMIIGGRGKKRVHQLKAATEALKFLRRFEKKFGSYQCKVLTGGLDLRKMDDMTRYIKENKWKKTCHYFVIESIDLLGKLFKKPLKRHFSNIQ
ncbi:MAG: C-GCAxxG-C-C family protein [Candidatus Helarchaeota archaeon]